jgi:tripartite-type tricarboxylate transporter receptor subunit TctC
MIRQVGVAGCVHLLSAGRCEHARHGDRGQSAGRDGVVRGACPAGTPRNVTEILRKEIARALEQPDVLQRFATLALDVEGRGPYEFRKLIADDVKRSKETAAKANIRFD